MSATSWAQTYDIAATALLIRVALRCLPLARRHMQVDASDFANVAFLGRRLDDEALPDVVRARALNLTPNVWAYLRRARADAQVVAKRYRDFYTTTDEEIDALVDQLRAARGFHSSAVPPVAHSASTAAGASAASNAPSGVAGPPVDTDAEFEGVWRGVLSVLAACHIVPAVYVAEGDDLLARELRRLLELAAVGVRVSGGKQAIFAGHQGIGKTTLMLYMASGRQCVSLR